MKLIIFLCLCAVFSTYSQSVTEFPRYFKFGSASASYQVEGAWNRDGKGESIWDRLTHEHPDWVRNRANGDDACKSYDLYTEDVQLLKNIGMDFYRFSISWSRILPKGDTSVVNEKGLQYYDELINELLVNGIEPMVTMYHWDLPQALQELGGLTNPAIIPYFVDYADIILRRYGNRVKTWATFNEPIISCEAYSGGTMAPKIGSPGVGIYMCSHNVLIAHAKIYRLYKEKYASQAGKMGIVINCGFTYPKDPNNPSDVAAADRYINNYCGIYAHPIFSKEGGYPPVVIEAIDRRSKNEGRAWSRLPVMDEETKDLIRGTADFYGLNYYTSNIATQQNYSSPSNYNDAEVGTETKPEWPVATSTWIHSIPDGLRQILNYIKNNFDGVETIITENGWSDDGSTLEDPDRIAYYKGHFQAILDAIGDGCNVTGHTTWSLMDNFEWMQGYSERFGIHHVDFNDPNRKRTPKTSVAWLKKVIETRKLD